MELSKLLRDVAEKAEADTTRIGEAHFQLLESIRKLNLAAETPAETLMRMRLEPFKNATIHIVLEAGFLSAIAEQRGKLVSATELAVRTGYDELLIVRLMRLATFVGVCVEVGDGLYAATDITRLICTPGIAGGEKFYFDLFFPIAARLMDYIRETGFHQFPKKPNEESPFEYTHDSGPFEFFEKNREQRKYFDDFMSVRRADLVIWYETYPIANQLGTGADKDPEAILLVDVGGGWGHDLKSFRKAYPRLSGLLILQDLPIIIDQVQSGGDADGLELMCYDIFTPQPVKDARAYYFHNICHNWPDTECIKFLTNTAKSMKKGCSRLLIDDYVLPNTGAPGRGSSMDIVMMMFFSGMERTVRQWHNLLDSCGLEIVQIWATRSDYESIIEAQLKDSGDSISELEKNR